MLDPASFSSSPVTPPLMPVDAAVVAELRREIPINKQAAYIDTSLEEHRAVIDKIRAVVAQPAGHLPREEELYLEQQLSDMLGFEVFAELENQRLNHSFGTMTGMPHLPRFPNDTLAQHTQILEAGIQDRRGSFGWFTELGQCTPAMSEMEKYCIAVQANFVPTWPARHKELKQWYKFRKMLVVNPIAEKAIVVVVGTLGPVQWMQYQFAGSPEVLRDGELWSYGSRGHVLVFFIQDSANRVPLGPVSL